MNNRQLLILSLLTAFAVPAQAMDRGDAGHAGAPVAELMAGFHQKVDAMRAVSDFAREIDRMPESTPAERQAKADAGVANGHRYDEAKDKGLENYLHKNPELVIAPILAEVVRDDRFYTRGPNGLVQRGVPFVTQNDLDIRLSRGDNLPNVITMLSPEQMAVYMDQVERNLRAAQ